MWVLAFAVVYPVGEFAVNDDWAYAKNVHNLVVNGKFVVDEWPAMNLISQTLYGSLAAGVFGFSFTVLRMAIFFLSVSSSLSLFKLAKKLSGDNAFVAFVFTAAYVFNTMYMHLSMTYMTDVFFVSMLIFAFNALVSYHERLQFSSYVWFCIWCVLAMLCRQQGLLFALLIVPAVVAQKKPLWQKLLAALIPVFLCWLAGDKYRHHLVANHVRHNIQQVHHLVDYLEQAPIGKHIVQGADMLLVLGGFFLPLSLFLLLTYCKRFQRKDIVLLTITTVVAIVCTIPAYGLYPMGNVSEMLEIGPRVLKGASEVIAGDIAVWLRKFYYFGALGSLSVRLFFIFKKQAVPTVLNSTMLSKGFYLLVALSYFLFIAVSNAYFDRYALPLILLLLLFVIPVQIASSSTVNITIAAAVFVTFLLGVIENLDYFNWQKKRAEAITYIYNKGALSEEIDGGFEFNGWVKKNNIYPSDTTKSWWWVVNDKYIVSAKAVEGTQIDTTFVYRRYLPFVNDTVFVLHNW
jgi:hypothetical protein